MIFFLIFLVCPLPIISRIHHLSIHNDKRRYIPLSTFGFYTGGKLQVNMTGFHLGDVPDYNDLDSVVGFSIDKTVSDALNPYVQATETQCILNKTLKDTDKAGIVRFILDFKKGVTTIKCSKNVRSITILDSPSKEVESVGALSDAGLFNRPNSDRQKRSLKDDNFDNFFASKLDREIDAHYEKVKEEHPETSDEIVPLKSTTPKMIPSTSKQNTNIAGKDEEDAKQVAKITPSPALDSCEDNEIPLKKDKNGYFETSFVIYISDAKLEGLYSMFFHNCFNFLHHSSAERKAVDFTILIEEKNSESYLSAGEMPLPALYQMLSILFFLSGCFWVFILKKNGSEQVFRIHWIMAALVFLKSLSLFFHGVNYNKIATNGIHMESWAILYYITHLLKGGLLFFTIVLIGSGWAFVKHVLSSNEKKVFMVVLPLQVISNVAYIILEESEQGEATHNFWKEVFVLIDLICCGAIMLPVVWSIRHLQDAQHTDGKAAVSLEKLKLFRHFYVMVVCYVYFTRIIVYLLRITVPFQYEWLDSMFKEVATLVFFVMTGYKFRPASNNPYFAVATDDDSEEVLIGSSSIREQVTNRKAYKIDDYEDEEETVVLFSKSDEISHDLD
eukprot:TRINITY_DN12482_c0_g1_i1.p1 TRINITY_DN12482_c0_g1~~TRINITY_DN12482_c0_g1_i1.p1  ORF type:complete len:615 (-),score=209.75 TRINITY_DN12482_c0_g1_i1:238-2082(-)